MSETVFERLARATRDLADVSRAPDRDAELLIAHALGCEPKRLPLMARDPLESDTLAQIDALIASRLEHRPVGQIIGSRAFWEHDFLVDQRVLEPRPDTETLVDAVLSRRRDGPLRVLDLGVGSGAILLSLLGERAAWRGVGVDKMPGPLEVTSANATSFGLLDRVALYAGDWFAALPDGEAPFDIIVSNPPYIRSGVIDDLDDDVRLFEPMAALDGGQDGLDAYRAIVSEAVRWLTPGGLLAFEIGFDQGGSVSALLKPIIAARGGADPLVLKDLAGLDRVVLIDLAA